MKLENKTPNYCATVVKLEDTYPLQNSDNLVWATFFWYENMNTYNKAKLKYFLERKIRFTESRINGYSNLDSSNATFHWWRAIWYFEWLKEWYTQVLEFLEDNKI